jgi:hypothetical protein
MISVYPRAYIGPFDICAFLEKKATREEQGAYLFCVILRDANSGLSVGFFFLAEVSFSFVFFILSFETPRRDTSSAAAALVQLVARLAAARSWLAAGLVDLCQAKYRERKRPRT